MLVVYGHYKYVCSYRTGIDVRRQILTSKVDPRAVRNKGKLETLTQRLINVGPALQTVGQD